MPALAWLLLNVARTSGCCSSVSWAQCTCKAGCLQGRPHRHRSDDSGHTSAAIVNLLVLIDYSGDAHGLATLEPPSCLRSLLRCFRYYRLSCWLLLELPAVPLGACAAHCPASIAFMSSSGCLASAILRLYFPTITCRGGRSHWQRIGNDPWDATEARLRSILLPQAGPQPVPLPAAPPCSCWPAPHLQRLWREEGGCLGADADVLDVEVQQGEQDDDRLLLQPRQVQRQRQPVHIGAKHLR